ncbi:MAG: sigma-54-dependent transcriptional regulator [Succinivibrionaceae bacterium]
MNNLPSTTLKARILIVEDSRSLNAFYTTILNQMNVDIRTATLGKNALELLNTFAPEIILLDLNLPDISGMEVLRKIKEKNLKIITIVMTAMGSVDYAVEAMRLGAYDFLEKPIDGNRLKTTIHNTIEKLELNALVSAYSDRTDIPGDFIGESPAMKEVYQKIKRIRNSKASVFITGESGTGKEVTAVTLHKLNTERKGKFVAINCAAIPHELMESEIFGHVKGAFTGATSDRAGAVTQANGGTLFLDELCEMDLDLQSKFLRFLQSSTFQKVGSNKTEEVDVRIICATNRNPLEEVKNGRFREDLFYRLFVIPIHLPPLRDRDNDIVLIAQKFVEHYAAEEKKSFKKISQDAQELLLNYNWPGNVRQLQNVIHSTVVLNDGEELTKAMLPRELYKKSPIISEAILKQEPILKTPILAKEDFINKPTDIESIETMDIIERRYILAAIEVAGGSVTKAAIKLKVNPSTIYRKIDKWESEGVISKISKYKLIN